MMNHVVGLVLLQAITILGKKGNGVPDTATCWPIVAIVVLLWLVMLVSRAVQSTM